MFNANNARTIVQGAIEADSDLFAAELEDRFKTMSLNDQQALMRKLREVVADPTSVSAFVAGQYAQNSSGQPAAALGAGSATTQQPADETAALEVLMASPLVDNGVKAALRRLLNPRDPQPILVEPDGTSSELVATRRERDAAKAERDAARTELADERDASKTGSLAKKLADATSAAAVPADLVRKADVQPLLADVEQAASQLSTGMLSSHIDGTVELGQAIDAAKAAVS